MDHSSRLQFLRAIGLAAAVPLAAASPRLTASDTNHAYLAAAKPDITEPRMWHGYPDECYSLTTFADSLVALTAGRGWHMQPPMVDLRSAIVLDFASSVERQAEESIARGWNGVWEFPMGVINTVASRTETNAQNARLERHLTLIGTAVRQERFHKRVVEHLFDSRVHPDCASCQDRANRTLADVLTMLARGTDHAAVQLFSRWKPSTALRDALTASGVAVVHHPLASIPGEDLEANRYYHIWDGTPLQAEEFRRVVWAPAWRQA